MLGLGVTVDQLVTGSGTILFHDISFPILPVASTDPKVTSTLTTNVTEPSPDVRSNPVTGAPAPANGVTEPNPDVEFTPDTVTLLEIANVTVPTADVPLTPVGVDEALALVVTVPIAEVPETPVTLTFAPAETDSSPRVPVLV